MAKKNGKPKSIEASSARRRPVRLKGLTIEQIVVRAAGVVAVIVALLLALLVGVRTGCAVEDHEARLRRLERAVSVLQRGQ